MELSIYQVIVQPVISQKAYDLQKRRKQLVFVVHVDANKPQILQAVEHLFQVKVKSVRTSVREGKQRRVRRSLVKGKTTKRAFITLEEGYELNLLGQVGESMNTSSNVNQSVTSAEAA